MKAIIAQGNETVERKKILHPRNNQVPEDDDFHRPLKTVSMC